LKLKSEFFEKGVKLSYSELSAAFTKQKRQASYEYLKDVSCVPLQQAIRHLDRAFTNFYKRRTEYPKFKSKRDNKQSAEYTASAFKYEKGQLSIAKVGRLNVVWSRVLEAPPTTVTITKDSCGRYFVTLITEEIKKDLPKTGKSIGIDLGVTSLATLSDGTKIENPRFLGRILRNLKHSQKTLSRRVKGSRRYVAQKFRVARLYAYAAACKRDHLNKLTTWLVRTFDVIAIEDLNVRGMMKNRKLARAISDVGFGEFRRQLEYKTTWYGKELRMAGRWMPTSKVCSNCGIKLTNMPLSIRNWTCLDCGAQHDRDVNAAINILAVGQTVTARGACVKPKGGDSPERNGHRSANQPALTICSEDGYPGIPV
jgi:putative transposase